MEVEDRLGSIRERIAAAEERGGRSAGSARLVAVGKMIPVEALRRLLTAGHSRFGENRVQEAEEKAAGLGPGAEWHLVGHLQSNKARRAAAIFHCIHSLDSEPLASRLAAAALALGRTLEVLVQVDMTGMMGRSGVAPADLTRMLEAVGALPGLRLAGLMVLPPGLGEAEAARPYFRRLAGLAEEAAGRGLLPAAFELSMGMSSDFEVAIEEGATLVGIGAALSGPRTPASA